MIWAAWFIGFVLEVSGAWLAFSKHKPLFFYLSFRALSDIVTVAILLSAGGDAYGYAAWIFHFVESGLMCWLLCYLIAAMANEYLTAVYPGMIAVLLATLYAAIFTQGETLADKLRDTGITASSALAVILLIGLMSKKVHLSRQLTLIGWAVCLSLASDGLLIGLSKLWLNALYLIPAGSLAALVMWNAAVWRKMAISIEFVPVEDVREAVRM